MQVVSGPSSQLIEESLSETSLSILQIITSQTTENSQHPIPKMAKIISRHFCDYYAKYTGGSERPKTQEERQLLIQKTISDSYSIMHTSGMSNDDVSQRKSNITVAYSTNLDEEDSNDDFVSVAMRASDQLYIAIKTLCLSLSLMYRYYVPQTE
jgi:hypothetical protein